MNKTLYTVRTQHGDVLVQGVTAEIACKKILTMNNGQFVVNKTFDGYELRHKLNNRYGWHVVEYGHETEDELWEAVAFRTDIHAGWSAEATPDDKVPS